MNRNSGHLYNSEKKKLTKTQLHFLVNFGDGILISAIYVVFY